MKTFFTQKRGFQIHTEVSFHVILKTAILILRKWFFDIFVFQINYFKYKKTLGFFKSPMAMKIIFLILEVTWHFNNKFL